MSDLEINGMKSVGDANTFELTGVNLESTQKLEKTFENQNLKENKDVPDSKDSKDSEPQKVILKVNQDPPRLQTNATLALNIKKEQSTMLKTTTTVQFAAKKDEKSDKKPESSTKLAPVKQPMKKSNIRSSTSNSSMPRNVMKIERLKNVLDEIKNAKKELKKTTSATGVHAFPEIYEQKIVEYFSLYNECFDV